MSVSETVARWLRTFSAVETVADNSDAMALEVGLIEAAFTMHGATDAMVDQTFTRIKHTSQSRAWPTVFQVSEAFKQVRRDALGEVDVASKRGDRSKLSREDLNTLDMKVLPTARRWLREFPAMRQHAISTLEYWKEPLKDDRGHTYKGSTK
jgi:hypothetical protein